MSIKDIYNKDKASRPNAAIPDSEKIFKCWSCENFHKLLTRCSKCTRCRECCKADKPEDGTLLKTFTEDKE